MKSNFQQKLEEMAARKGYAYKADSSKLYSKQNQYTLKDWIVGGVFWFVAVGLLYKFTLWAFY